MKATSEASRVCFEMIRDFQGFKNSVVLKVSKESVVAAPNLFDKNTAMTSWQAIRIDVDLPLEALDKISDILQPVKILSLAPSRLQPNDAYFRDEDFSKFIAAVLTQSLVEVSIPVEVWKASNITAMTLPGLKRLKVEFEVVDCPKFEAFLENLPLLDELDVSVVDTPRVFVNISLLEVIKRRCANLKKLHLKLRNFVGIEGNVDWSFLGEMKHLKDFQINRPNIVYFLNDSFGTGPQFLYCLPKNQLEKLSLQGIRCGLGDVGFWTCLNYGHFRGYNVESLHKTSTAEILDLPSRFRNLRRLSFRNSPNAVDNELLRFILRENTSLEELEFTLCPYLTNDGIAGIGNLKGQYLLEICVSSKFHNCLQTF